MLYVLGGEEPSSGRIYSACEMFDYRAGRWYMLPSMQIERSCFGAALDSIGRLYAIGGDRGGSEAIRACERLDLRFCSIASSGAGISSPTNFSARQHASSSPHATWQRIPDLFHSRRGHAVCVGTIPISTLGHARDQLSALGLLSFLVFIYAPC